MAIVEKPTVEAVSRIRDALASIQSATSRFSAR